MQKSLPERYCDAVNAGDAEAIIKLFSPDSVFLGADGIKRIGREEILAFYVQAFGSKDYRTTVGRTIQQGNLLMFEVLVHTSPMGAHGQANALDVVELDADGLIAHKVVFHPPGRIK